MKTESTEKTLTPVSEAQIQQMISNLKNEFEYGIFQFKLQTSQKERYEDLMRRNSSKSWKPEKVAKMVRRLTNINEKIEKTELNLERVKSGLSQY